MHQITATPPKGPQLPLKEILKRTSNIQAYVQGDCPDMPVIEKLRRVTEDTYIISHFLYRHINEPDGQDRPATDDDDYAQVKKLYQWLSQILIPPGYILGQWDNDKVEDDDYDEDDGGEQDTQQRDQEPIAAATKPGRRQKGGAQAEKQPTADEVFVFSCSAHLALSVLEKLDFLFPLGGYHEGRLDVMARMAIYTDKRDPWSSSTGSCDAAKRLIGKYVPLSHPPAETPTPSSSSSPAVPSPALATAPWSSSTSSPFPVTKSALFDHILSKIVKPIFARTKKNPDVTSEGRKAMSTNLMRTKHERSGGGVVFGKEEKHTKPWKYDKRYILTIFRWVLLNMDGHMKVRAVQCKWPLIVPPLLALLDDHSTTVKAKGCELLTILLRNTTPQLLESTGLGDVFQDALMPCLSYLPSLTPPAQSASLLAEAYPALLQLSRVRYPYSMSLRSSTSTATKRQPYGHGEEELADVNYKPKRVLLDKIMRDGILTGYAHCREFIRVAVVLVDQMGSIVEEMGIWAVKHLKHILPLLSDILAEPMGMACPALLVAATKTQAIVLKTCWPRVTAHRAEVIRGVVICFGYIVEIADDAENENLGGGGQSSKKYDQLFEDMQLVQRQLLINWRLLVNAVGDGVDIRSELQSLGEIDNRILALLEEMEKEEPEYDEGEEKKEEKGNGKEK